MKRKEINFKLGIYTLLEDKLKYIIENSEEIEKKFIHEFAEIIHNSNLKT